MITRSQASANGRAITLTKRTIAPVLHTGPEAITADRASERRTRNLIERARKEDLVLARPSVAWVYGEDELRRLILRTMDRSGSRFLRCLRLPENDDNKSPKPLTGLGTPDSEYYLGIQGFYSSSFTRPSAWVLKTNSALTGAVALAGGNELHTARNDVIRRLLRK
jgi:hypothetical protein